jgi:hypothetical protein
MEIKQYRIPIRKVALIFCFCLSLHSCEKFNQNQNEEFVTIQLNNLITKSINFSDFISSDIELTMTQLSNGNKYKIKLNKSITIPKDTYVITGKGGYVREDYECNGTNGHWSIGDIRIHKTPWINIRDTIDIFESKTYNFKSKWNCGCVIFNKNDVSTIDVYSKYTLAENIPYIIHDDYGILFIYKHSENYDFIITLNPKTENVERTEIKFPITNFKHGHYYKLEINNCVPIEITNNLEIPIMMEGNL